MALYSIGTSLGVNAQFSAGLDVKAPANTSAKVLEIGLSTFSAVTNSTFGLGFSANVTTQTTSVLFQPDDAADQAAKSTVGVAWSVAPIPPGVLSDPMMPLLRRVRMVGISGCGFMWTFVRGISLPAAGVSLVVWNMEPGASVGAAPQVWIVLDE